MDEDETKQDAFDGTDRTIHVKRARIDNSEVCTLDCDGDGEEDGEDEDEHADDPLHEDTDIALDHVSDEDECHVDIVDYDEESIDNTHVTDNNATVDADGKDADDSQCDDDVDDDDDVGEDDVVDGDPECMSGDEEHLLLTDLGVA